MTEQLRAGDLDQVFARAIELDGVTSESVSRAAVVQAAAEVGIDEPAILSALAERAAVRPPTLLDRVLGPDRVVAARWLPANVERVTNAAGNFMADRLMTPATRPRTWLQQRSTWPDPLATNSVTAVSVTAAPAAAGTATGLHADLGDARSGYLLSFMIAAMTAMLLMVTLPLWGPLIAAAIVAVTAWSLRSGYRHKVHAVSEALAAGLDQIERCAEGPSRVR